MIGFKFALLRAHSEIGAQSKLLNYNVFLRAKLSEFFADTPQKKYYKSAITFLGAFQ
jgi:hypothetical protein